MAIAAKMKSTQRAQKREMHALNLVRSSLVLFLGFGLCACSPTTAPATNSSPETGSGANPIQSPDAVKPPSEKGSLPSMPEDVPIYAGSNQTTGTQVGSQTVGSWKTTDPTDKVVAFYAKALPDAGWTVDKNDGSALGATLNASKQGRTLMVAITRALPEGSVFNISHKP